MIHAPLLSRIFRITKPPKFFIFISIIFAVLSSCLEGVSFGLLIPLLDGLIKGGDFRNIYNIPFFGHLVSLLPIKPGVRTFLSLVCVILGIVCITQILRFLSELSMANVSEGAGHTLRRKIFERFMGFTKPFYDNNKVGFLHNILLSQVDKTVDFVSLIYKMLLLSIIAGVYLSIMFFISWRLTLTALIFLPAIATFINIVIRKIEQTARARIKTEQEICSQAFSTLSAIPLVKAQVSEQYESEKFAFSSEILRQEKFSILKKIMFIPHIQEIAIAVSIAILIGIATVLFTKGTKEILAAFLVYFVILRRLVGEFKQISQINGVLASVTPSVKGVLWVFDDRDKHFMRDGTINFLCLKDKISFESLSFYYEKSREILKDVSFSIPKGSMIAIIGPTGSGKTTLISLIPRFYDPIQGSLKIDGIDIGDYKLESLRKRIAIVSQDIFIFNDTIRNNMIYGLQRKIEQDELDSSAELANLYEFITSLPKGYETIVGDRGVKLSGGEKQRVAIARAILKNPDILILDEATSSLDTRTERLIQNAINNLIKDKTTIVIAHRLSTIEHADWVVVLEEGRITEEGKPNELLDKKGSFYQYWKEQKFY